jgi:predicted restriction endonuclease
VQDLVRQSHLRPVIIHNGSVIDADGELNLGRTTRLANRAQRRALRALYTTCAAPGCSVGVQHCKPHHVHWWRHGGPTDLGNLLPLCSKHHHLAHEGGWLLTLGPNRELTITLPDGQIMRTGPPSRKAAA